MRLFALVLGLALAASGCAPPKEAYLLSVTATPNRVRDDGTPVQVKVSAINPNETPGKGSVQLKSSAGDFIDGVNVQLDEMGTATADFSCDVKQDPACKGKVTITASWLVGGYVITSEVNVTAIVTDARASACAPMNLRTVNVPVSTTADIKLAIPDDMPDVRSIGLGAMERGLSIASPALNVAAIAVTGPAQVANLTDENRRVRGLIATTGSITNPLEQTFITWDGYSAVRTSFQLAGTDTLKARIDAVSMKLIGQTTSVPTSTAKGPYRAVMTVVARANSQTIVVFAIAPIAGFNDNVARRLDDIAGGSALAGANDKLSPSQCETYVAQQTAKADVLWVVDDSCSMESSQTAVATVGAAVVSRLTGAFVDFQAAGVSTGYYDPGYSGSVRDWTPEVSTMLSWFHGGGAWGTGGDPSEAGFSGLRSFVLGLHPNNATVLPGPPRSDADIHVIFLSDAPEQSTIAPLEALDMLTQRFPGQRIVAHGIVCPESPPPPAMRSMCGDEPESQMGKYHELIRKTGGVLGSILTFNQKVTPAASEQQAETMKLIVQSVISGTGFTPGHRPIAASARVASSATRSVCDNTDIPRDDDNGWQLDSLAGRLSFAGNCSPPLGATIALSYQYWTH